MPLAVVTVAVVIFGAIATTFGSPDFLRAVTAAFTFANTAIILYHSRRVKKDIMPKVDKIEHVAESLDPRMEGGRRSTDPCPPPADLPGFKYRQSRHKDPGRRHGDD